MDPTRNRVTETEPMVSAMNSIRSVNLQMRAMRTHRQERVRMLWGGRLFAHSGEDASCFSRSCRVRWTKARQGGRFEKSLVFP